MDYKANGNRSCCLCGILRTYYAIYVYYYTYDITWWAHEGWVWTALEAELGIICACAPALKIFLRRYFNHSTIGSTRRPTKATVVPLNSIKVSTSHVVIISRREDTFNRSQASTSNLTALPAG